MVLVLDYGMGNLLSVKKALEEVGFKVKVSQDWREVKGASLLVLPGVGAFGDAVKNLKRLNLFEEVIDYVKGGKPFFGICLGMQLLFERSYEFGINEGLGLIKGEVVRFPNRLRVPHIGWNQVWKRKEEGVLKGIREGEYFYFVHSYYCKPKEEDVILTTTDYGIEFTSSILKGNIFAVQFHPEKSQRAGLRLLKNLKEIF